VESEAHDKEDNLMSYENIPQQIRENMGFCCWNPETRKGSPTKIAYNPLNRRKVHVDRPRDFVDFNPCIPDSPNGGTAAFWRRFSGTWLLMPTWKTSALTSPV
jgi:hypothetical protein